MYDLFCTVCSDGFQAVRPDKHYCSTACQAKAGRIRRGEQTNVTLAGRDCLGCGQHFDITPPSTNQRYCSDDCARNAAKKQRNKFHERNPGKWAVYNAQRPYRDGGVVGRMRRKYPDLPVDCEACGESRVLELAHKPGFERRGAWRLMSNTQRHMIWVLCPTCHKLIDKHICTPSELGLK